MTTLDPILTESMALPPPEPPPEPAAGPGDWARRNLFRTWVDGVVTVIAAMVIGYVAFRLARFVFVSGRWEIVQRNLTLFMVGRYPRDELWRIGVGLCAIAAYGGVLAGYVQRMRRDHRPRDRGRCRCANGSSSSIVRIWPLIARGRRPPLADHDARPDRAHRPR